MHNAIKLVVALDRRSDEDAGEPPVAESLVDSNSDSLVDSNDDTLIT